LRGPYAYAPEENTIGGQIEFGHSEKFHIASGIGHTPDEPWSPRRFIWAPTVAKITRTARPLSDRCPAHQTSAWL